MSAASGRSPALRDSMVCTMFSCTGTTEQRQRFSLTALRKNTNFILKVKQSRKTFNNNTHTHTRVEDSRTGGEDKGVRGFPVQQNHRLQNGIMLIPLEAI